MLGWLESVAASLPRACDGARESAGRVGARGHAGDSQRAGYTRTDRGVSGGAPNERRNVRGTCRIRADYAGNGVAGGSRVEWGDADRYLRNGRRPFGDVQYFDGGGVRGGRGGSTCRQARKPVDFERVRERGFAGIAGNQDCNRPGAGGAGDSRGGDRVSVRAGNSHRDEACPTGPRRIEDADGVQSARAFDQSGGSERATGGCAFGGSGGADGGGAGVARIEARIRGARVGWIGRDYDDRAYAGV